MIKHTKALGADTPTALRQSGQKITSPVHTDPPGGEKEWVPGSVMFLRT